MKPHGFPKVIRLLRSTDFRRVYDRGRRQSLDGMVAFFLATDNPSSRIGFTVPAAFGPAVDRNRIKRRLREAIRMHWTELGPGWDIVLNPRRVALDFERLRIEDIIRNLFQSCARAGQKAGA